MKRIALALALSLLSILPALSADDPYKAAQLFTWSGLYVGGDLGYARQPMDTTGFVAAKVTPDGWLGCGHIGYDHQFHDRIIAGVVTDICGGDVSGSTKLFGANVPAKADLFGTLRGKLGYALYLGALPLDLYATGGLAWSKNNVAIGSATAQDTQLGWTAGIGADVALSNHIIVGAEYLFAGYGRGNYTFAPGATVPLNVNSNRATAKISYKF